MSDQLTLSIDTPLAHPDLTDRQRTIWGAVRRAGHEGLTAVEAGDLLSRRAGRPPGQWDASSGQEVLKALAKKGLVRYRRANRTRPGGWVATDTRDETPNGMLADNQPLPY